MRTSLPLTAALALLTLPPAAAQAQALPFDHVHIAVPNIAEAVAWYGRTLSGQAIPGEPANRVMIGTTRIVFMERNPGTPATTGVIDHVGYRSSNIAANTAAILAAGGTRLPGTSHTPGAIMLADPWGTHLELVPAQAPGVHHVHLTLPDPKAAATWYRTHFGGSPAAPATLATIAHNEAVAFGDVLLTITQGNANPSEGTTHDHFGWQTPSLEPLLNQLRAASVRLLSGIEARGATTRVIFIEGPAEAKIELLQR